MNEDQGIVYAFVFLSLPFHTYNAHRYFKAGNPSTIQRHIFSVPIPDHNSVSAGGNGFTPASLTDTSQVGWYSASFSPDCGFYVLRYDGPEVPSQRVLSVHDDCE